MESSGVSHKGSRKRMKCLPGVSGNYLATPDSAALDIAADIDIRIRIDPSYYIGNRNIVKYKIPVGTRVSRKDGKHWTNDANEMWFPFVTTKAAYFTADDVDALDQECIIFIVPDWDWPRVAVRPEHIIQYFD